MIFLPRDHENFLSSSPFLPSLLENDIIPYSEIESANICPPQMDPNRQSVTSKPVFSVCCLLTCIISASGSRWAKRCFDRIKYQPVLPKPVLSVAEFRRNYLLLLSTSAFY